MSRSAAVALAEYPSIKSIMLRRGIRGPLARRYTGGESLHEALQVVKEFKEQEINATVEFLPDDLVSADDMDGVVAQYLEILKGVATFYPEAWISVRLSAIGLVSDPAVARTNLIKLLDDSVARGSVFIRIAMDQSKYTQEIISIVTDLHGQYSNLGITLQSNLRRTDRDVIDLLAAGVSIRLVKGRSDEPPSVAYTKDEQIKAAFRRQMFELIESGSFHSIATHDLDLIKSAQLYAKQKNVPKSNYNFEMYKGVRTDLQTSLTKEGYSVRVFVPYGAAWYPYVLERLSQNPGGIAFLLANLLG